MSDTMTISTIAVDLPFSIPMPPGWPVQEPALDLLPLLTPREREILPLLAARWTDKEIADVLCISYRTVTTHVTHIFDKLGITSRRATAMYLWALSKKAGEHEDLDKAA